MKIWCGQVSVIQREKNAPADSSISALLTLAMRNFQTVNATLTVKVCTPYLICNTIETKENELGARSMDLGIWFV